MNTLLFTLEYPPFKGGVANYYGALVKYWPETGKIFVLHNNQGELVNNNLPFFKWLPAVIALKKEVKRQKIDQIIVGQILPLGLAAWLVAKLTGVKYSLILHGMDFSYALRSARKKFAIKLILKQADKIIVSNNYTADLIKNFLGGRKNEKILTVNPGAEPVKIDAAEISRLKNEYHLENKTVLLSVGRLVKRKGFASVIESLPEVLKKAPNLFYVIVGRGQELENLRSRINALKLNNDVAIVTDASDAERDAWYAASDIFVMPSRDLNGDFEGFGIVYLEANLAGRPVIANRSGGAADAVIHGLNGLTIEPGDSNQLKNAIINLALNPVLRTKLGEQGRERALKEFNWPKQINKLFQFIKI